MAFEIVWPEHKEPTVNFRAWIYGLAVAFITGGANAVTVGVYINMMDPGHFNPSNPSFYRLLVAVFLGNGLLNAFLYLSKSPLPALTTVVTTVEKTELQQNPMAKVVTTVEETKTESK